MNSRARAAFTAVAAAAAVAGAVAALAQATGPGNNGAIAFTHQGKLFVVNADGTGLRKLTTGPHRVYDGGPEWSPDGSRIAFHRCFDRCNVWTVAASGTGLRRLGPAGDDRAQPAWAPNGNQIAYSRGWGRVQNDQIEHAEIYLMNANGGAARPLTAITASKPFSADVEGAAWSPGGKQLVFEVHNSKLGEPADGRALFVIEADGSGQRQLTPWSLNAGGARPDWSPNGRLILFRVAGAKRQHGNIYTVHPDGSGLKQLTRYPEPKSVGEESSSFSPDGKWITFSRFSTTAYPEIFVMRSDGMGVRQLTTTQGNFSPDWGRTP